MKKSTDRENTEKKDEKVNGPLGRRGFIQGFGAGSAVVVAAGLIGCGDDDGGTNNNNVNDNNNNTNDNTHDHPAVFTDVLVGTIEDGTGRDYSPITGAERVAIPSACWQCVARDGIICYVEDGRLEHIEGNHRLLRTNGKLCARGQGGVGQVYDPDRLLFPMRHTGTTRGDGSWERISWADAMADLDTNLRPLITNGEPEKLYFHYGRMKASASKIIKDYFLKAFGTGTISGHTAICESNKWTGQELVWGKHYDVWDVEHSNVILNFGCNPLEAHTNHLALGQRLSHAIEQGTPMYSFDVRLSNTAAKSTAWHPVNPGTDQAVLLAMANHIITNSLMPQEGIDFINEWTDLNLEGGTFATKVDKLEYFLTNPRSYLQDARAAAPGGAMPAYFEDADQPAGGYTPAWAEGISGVPAATIISIAEEYANNSPGSVIMTYRGAVMHFNGTYTEMVAQMLEGMCGNIDVQGGRVHGVGAGWDYHDTYPTPSAPVDAGKLSLENKSAYVIASHGANHQTLETIKASTIANGNVSPISCYMVYCYTPAYANGNMQESIDILKSKTYIPYMVVSDVAYTEAAMYADLLLPDTNYLERWDWEDMVSQHHIPEWYIRQPAVAPLGEAEDFKDTLISLSGMLATDRPELQAVADIGSAENFVEAACNDTPEVHDAGVAAGYANGFEFMKAEGAYYDPNATPAYLGYMSTVTITDTIYDAGNPPPNDGADYTLQDPDGTIYTGNFAEFTAGYRATGYKHYVAQELASNPGTYYKGFKPDKVNKSGLFELESVVIGAKDWPPMPVWSKVPEHQSLANDELIVTTFKDTVQTHSRTQNCKYNTEISHHNPAWINTATAASLGISDGDMVTLTRTVELLNDMTLDPAQTKGTSQSSMQVEVKVTQAVHPKVIAISHSLGHWAYGRYASGIPHPMATETDQAAHVAGDPDADLIWWNEFGYRHNWIQPNAGDPVGGGLRFFDTVVTIS